MASSASGLVPPLAPVKNDGGRWDGLPPSPTVEEEEEEEEEDVYATAVEHADLSLEDPDFWPFG